MPWRTSICKHMTYEIQFHDYWHAGSGQSGGTRADQLVNRTREGFPRVPGRTVKGLLRHAAEDLCALDHPQCTRDAIDAVFGRHPDATGTGRYETMGAAFFGDATLNAATQSAIGEERSPLLYDVLANTAIDPASGTVKDKTLRQIEVTIPLRLYGQIDGADGYQKLLQTCCRYVKRLGQQRSRGLGRCTLNILDQ